ncbi:uncharacterized protein LOC117193772 [Drosophila miranda]|uniref:uncharacterized protein LOC117193772 n=1 Tax=Drosophila miranda TaxID=7229 RepID=UPI00143F9A61|nr:uncharacterized protein LOC117193772 [Drosophila miranda]
MAQRHTACAASFYIVHKYNEHLNEMWTYEGPDCIQKFCQALRMKTDGLYEKYWKSYKKPIYQFNIWDEDYQEHGDCYACEKQISDDDREKFFDQFTGQYVGPIHKLCKQTFRLSDPFFPVVFQNLSRYDIHLFVTSIKDELRPIPCNKELYIALTQNCKLDESYLHQYKIRYIDSNRFLNSSLEKLASYMNIANFKILKTKYQGEKFDMLRRKGVFPYDYLDSFEKFDESLLPSRDNFYNSLNDEECSVKDYNFAQKVWSAFNCKSIRDYLKLYLESDVLILADGFENFRSLCSRVYRLDPINYVTAPSVSWDAMLKYTRVELELVIDPDIYNFFKTAVRGGLTQCTQRIATANNKYLNNKFKPTEPINFLSYIDANNLYGWAMSQPLPFSNFKFLSNDEISSFNVLSISASSDVGYILEVDMRYPDDIHNKHNSLPFCPENKIPPGGKQTKLIADLTDKKNYIIHLKQLQQLCIEQGMTLEKISRVLSFNQSCWLKPYIDLNTSLRK